LHVPAAHLDRAQALIADHLAGQAEVYPVADLIARGFFGPPAPRFLERVGNLVVLPYEGQSVYWRGGGRFGQSLWGNHGGLTRAEMETILLARAYR